MNILMSVLRIIHIFSGVFWVGFSLFNIGYLQPAVQATGAEGQKIMQYLTQKTRLLSTVYTVSTLTMLSGLLMYWILFGFRLSAMLSGYGLILAIGGVAGVIAWLIAIVMIRGTFNQMGTIGKEIQAQGGPPTPEQGALLGALVARLGRLGQVAIVFMLIALLGMSIAQYNPF